MNRPTMLGMIIAAAAAGAAGGYHWAQRNAAPAPMKEQGAHAADHGDGAAGNPAGGEGREVLYWYDPMFPSQRFDQPGKSPFMDMELVPRYAEEAEEAATVRIDPAVAQNLGMRVARIEIGSLPHRIDAVGALRYDARKVSVLQARAAGFVERVYGRAPGDVIAAGAPLADLLIPEWAGAQAEYLALLRLGDEPLIAAMRERLRLLGMPAELIAEVERRRAPRTTVTVRSPAAGVIDTLEVRAGMTVAAGQTLATVNGIDTVWLEAAVPEAQAAAVGVGDAVTATLAAFGGESFRGNVTAVLPAADTETRTVTVRVEFDNGDGRLRPGMYARVQLRGAEPPARPLVPVEALIRTGRRTLVMKAEDDRRYRPVEIEVGREADGLAEVLSGLRAGDQVVVSGQFLIDSEASLAGVAARSAPAPEPAAGTLHETDGTVVSVSGTRIELDHAAFTTMAMPAMRMTYRLADAGLAAGVQPGQRVRFAVRETGDGPVIERLERIGETP